MLIKNIKTYPTEGDPQGQKEDLFITVFSPQHSTWYIVSVKETYIKIPWTTTYPGHEKFYCHSLLNR